MKGTNKKVLDVVKAFAEEKMYPASSDKGTIMVYSSERDEALRLDAQYKLGILNQ